MKKAASAFLVLALACSGAQSGHKPKISADAASTDALATQQVIVQWNIPIGDATAALITSVGGTVISEFKSVRQGLYLVPGSALGTLSSDPIVKYISADRKVKRKLATTAATINAPQVWSAGFTGTGVGVAVLDSGINQDDNLGVQADKTITFVNDFTPNAYDATGKKTSSFGLDWYGHGQHIAGIIASSGKASICGRCSKSMIGIASGASLIDLKVLDATGEGTDSQVIAAINQAIQLKNTYNIRVINLSLGRPVLESYTDDPLCQAVEAAWKAGIVVVVAAGNDGRDNSANNQGYGTILAPGNDPYVITVGSMKTMNTNDRSDDLIASYSSKGPSAIDHVVKPDILAPGNLMVSLLAQHGRLALANPQNAVTLASIQGGSEPSKPATSPVLPSDLTKEPPGVNFGGGYSAKYYTLSGTSMAAGVVSGAVADLIQAYPALTPDQIKILLMQTASKTFPASSYVVDDQGNTYTSYYDMFTVGAGYLNLNAAFKGAGNVPTSGNSLSPVSSYDSTSGNVYVSFDPQSAWTNPAVWSNKSMWGASSVWSSSVLNGSSAIWSSKSMWGASADSASKSLWGAKSMWGASSDQSASSMDSASSAEVSGEN
ncbi:MAG TPA: S8 family peptidase [Bryobacteraceae bacterium]|jgi:serine protease AprX|nr:S8 family peptidase [Bryobacteraceae bacterium]